MLWITPVGLDGAQADTEQDMAITIVVVVRKRRSDGDMLRMLGGQAFSKLSLGLPVIVRGCEWLPVPHGSHAPAWEPCIRRSAPVGTLEHPGMHSHAGAWER
ncbi:hypothetical protein D3C81_1017890 [compost metagenome]